MARIFYMGAPSHVKLPENASVTELLKATGNNTGNLLIGHAIKRQLKVEQISSDLSLDRKFIESNFDCVVIGASNFLFPKFDFSAYATFLEAVKLPCVIIGLGAQAPDFSCRVEVPQGTERMLRIISERSTSLGVRGYFTASTLIDMGIKNVRVIGCPSMYWSGQPSLKLNQRATNGHLAVAVNGSASVVQHSVDVEAAKRVEAMIVRLSFDHGYPYVLQNESALFKISAGAQNGHDKDVLRSLMTNYGFSDISEASFVDFVKRNMKSYFDIDGWLAGMKGFDFVMGSRFHGCLIGLLAGVPCHIFVHDTRTREMCELLKIPHIDVRKVGSIDVKALYDSLDLQPMETAYRYLYQNYRMFLEENGIAHSLAT